MSPRTKSTSDSSAQLGFEAKLWLSADKLRNNMDAAEASGARQIAKGNPQGERGGVHRFGVPPKTAMRGSAISNPESTLRVVSEAKDNNANFAWVQHFIHHLTPHGIPEEARATIRNYRIVRFEGSAP